MWSSLFQTNTQSYTNSQEFLPQTTAVTTAPVPTTGARSASPGRVTSASRGAASTHTPPTPPTYLKAQPKSAIHLPCTGSTGRGCLILGEGQGILCNLQPRREACMPDILLSRLLKCGLRKCFITLSSNCLIWFCNTFPRLCLSSGLLKHQSPLKHHSLNDLLPD